MIVPKGHALVFTNKSGVAAKKHLLVGSCVVDSDYRGETFIQLINTSTMPIHVSPGEKIVQGIVYEVGSHVPCEVDDIMNYSEVTERGEGGFGSSGVN
jgi:dUTP pyrophosphatase